MEVHRVRRALTAGLTSAVVALATIATTTGTAGAVEDVQRDRIAGTDRFETAADIAAAVAPDGAPIVAVASGRAFPDALAGAGLGVPVLLTEPDALPDATADALTALEPEDILVLGGTAAVSAAVAQELAAFGDVTRVAGVDRYETAASMVACNDVEADRTALIATGTSFADALAGGPLTRGDDSGSFPILLVSDSVPDATREALETCDYDNTIILGGTGAVSPAVAAELEEITGTEPVRLAGTNRFGTAAAVGEFAIDELGFPADEVLLANGLVFADALAGGPLGRVREAPIVLTPADGLPSETEAFLDGHADTIEQLTVLGGTAAVSESTAADAESMAEELPDEPADRANETISVAPTAAATQANRSTREYSVTGLTSGVDIVLVRCESVSTATNGSTVFVNANGNTIADGTANTGSSPDVAQTPSYISSVNGSPQAEVGPTVTNNDYAGGVAPANGTVTFAVTGPEGASTATSCVRPVVFDDANSDNALNVPAASSPAAPNEAFGTGGATTFSAAAAGGGQFSGRDVASNDDAGNTFVACTIVGTAGGIETVDSTECSTYAYDSTDVFQISSQPVDLATFELRLTGDDDIAGTYNPTGNSTFNLTDEGPSAPSSPAADPTETTSSGATISFGESATTTTDSYRLVRVPQPTGGGTCTLTGTGATAAGTVADPTPGTYDPTTRPEITDSTAAAGTDYCYFVVPVDDGDDGTASSAVEVTTDNGPAPGAPIISAATGRSANSTLDADGDQHQLVFSKAMAATTANGSYTVTGGGTPLPTTIACSGAGKNADCVLVAGGTTLKVALIGPFLTAPTYPLTITSTTGMTDSTGEPVNLAAINDDQTIEGASLTADAAGPFVQSAKMVTDPGATDGFDDAGDVMDLVFSEEIVLVDADGFLTEAQVKAITGVQTVAYGAAPLSVRAAVVGGTTLRLTIDTALATGIALGAVVDGTNNTNVTDGFSNDQVVNPTANPVLTAA